MGLLFDPSEVFQIAVRIEVNGERFYREMASRLDDAEVGRLFIFLAEEEVGHREFYEELLAGVEPFDPEESVPGEYADYLHAYADGVIFNQQAFEKKLDEIRDVQAALDFAIGVEWDSIHFYQELKNLVPANRRNRLNELIAEERKHFVRLSKMKKEQSS